MKCLLRMFFCLVFLMSLSVTAYADAYQKGDEGQDIAVIQERLVALGYDVGVADGDFGDLTEQAVKSFQRDRGLEVDGIVGPQTYRALVGRDMPPVSRDSSSSKVRKIIQYALSYQGVPYVFGGTGSSGFDCSGFTQHVFKKVGVYLPRSADEQYDLGRYVSYNGLQPGDLVYFSTYAPGPSHVGIYIGSGKFISATSSRGVAVDYMNSGYWGARYIGARRII